MKLVRTTEQDVCFDLRADPDERRPIPPRLSAHETDEAEGVGCDPRGFDLLETWLDGASRAAQALGTGVVHELTPAERERLRTLGYTD